MQSLIGCPATILPYWLYPRRLQHKRFSESLGLPMAHVGAGSHPLNSSVPVFPLHAIEVLVILKISCPSTIGGEAACLGFAVSPVSLGLCE